MKAEPAVNACRHRPVSIHTGAWRYPGAYRDANFNFAHLKRFAQTLEQAFAQASDCAD